MGKFKGAVIGINGIGKWHGAMQRDTGEIDVIAICDANPKMKAVAEEHFPEAAFYTDAKTMLKAEDLDVASIAVPHVLHAPLSTACNKAGVGVVVEKPMATTYADCKKMIAAAKKHKTFVTVFHNRRLDPWFLATKQIIEEGVVGKVFEINSGIGYAGKSPTWRGNKEASGGVVFDWGAHLVDYSLHFDTSAIAAVSGWLYRGADSKPEQNHDHGVLRIYFESGATANITISSSMYARPDRYRIYGERGTIVDQWAFSQEGALTVHSKFDSRDYQTQVPYIKSNTQDYYANVLAHLNGEADLMVSAESAARVINVLTTAERSAAKAAPRSRWRSRPSTSSTRWTDGRRPSWQPVDTWRREATEAVSG